VVILGFILWTPSLKNQLQPLSMHGPVLMGISLSPKEGSCEEVEVKR